MDVREITMLRIRSRASSHSPCSMTMSRSALSSSSSASNRAPRPSSGTVHSAAQKSMRGKTRNRPGPTLEEVVSNIIAIRSINSYNSLRRRTIRITCCACVLTDQARATKRTTSMGRPIRILTKTIRAVSPKVTQTGRWLTRLAGREPPA